MSHNRHITQIFYPYKENLTDQRTNSQWVQFYNNGICNIGQPGFVSSFTAWSKNIAGGPQLYIGAPACQACAGTGYLAPDAITTAIKSATAANVPNMGGVMLWDGSEAMTNMASGGQNYNQVVKAALG